MTEKEVVKLFRSIYPKTESHIGYIDEIKDNEIFIIQAIVSDGIFYFYIKDNTVSKGYETYNKAREATGCIIHWYLCSLLYYTDENVPECGATCILKSTDDLTSIRPNDLINDTDIAKLMEDNNCESVDILEIDEEEAKEYDDKDIIEIHIKDLY